MSNWKTCLFSLPGTILGTAHFLSIKISGVLRRKSPPTVDLLLDRHKVNVIIVFLLLLMCYTKVNALETPHRVGIRSTTTPNPILSMVKDEVVKSEASRNPKPSDSAADSPLASDSAGDSPLTSDSAGDSPLTSDSASDSPHTSDSVADSPTSGSAGIFPNYSDVKPGDKIRGSDRVKVLTNKVYVLRNKAHRLWYRRNCNSELDTNNNMTQICSQWKNELVNIFEGNVTDLEITRHGNKGEIISKTKAGRRWTYKHPSKYFRQSMSKEKIQSSQRYLPTKFQLSDYVKENKITISETDKIQGEDKITNSETDKFQGEDRITNSEKDKFEGENRSINSETDKFQGEDRITNSETDKFQGEDRITNSEKDKFEGENRIINSETDKFQGEDRIAYSETDKFQGEDRITNSENGKFQGEDRITNSAKDKFQGEDKIIHSETDKFQREDISNKMFLHSILQGYEERSDEPELIDNKLAVSDKPGIVNSKFAMSLPSSSPSSTTLLQQTYYQTSINAPQGTNNDKGINNNPTTRLAIEQEEETWHYTHHHHLSQTFERTSASATDGAGDRRGTSTLDGVGGWKSPSSVVGVADSGSTLDQDGGAHRKNTLKSDGGIEWKEFSSSPAEKVSSWNKSSAPFMEGDWKVDSAPYKEGDWKVDSALYKKGDWKIDSAPDEVGIWKSFSSPQGNSLSKRSLSLDRMDGWTNFSLARDLKIPSTPDGIRHWKVSAIEGRSVKKSSSPPRSLEYWKSFQRQEGSNTWKRYKKNDRIRDWKGSLTSFGKTERMRLPAQTGMRAWKHPLHLPGKLNFRYTVTNTTGMTENPFQNNTKPKETWKSCSLGHSYKGSPNDCGEMEGDPRPSLNLQQAVHSLAPIIPNVRKAIKTEKRDEDRLFNGQQRIPQRHKRGKIDLSDVTVMEGDLAVLPCDLRVAEPKDSVQIILWIKEGLHTPVYSYDYRELLGGRPKETKPDANSTLSRRTSFRTDRSPAALLIERAKAQDGGIYRCRVDFMFAPTINKRVNLTVVVPPREVKISWLLSNSSWSPITGPVVGPFLEHSQPTLNCINVDGWPPSSVVWYEGDELLDDSYAVDDTRKYVENELTLLPLTRNDLGRRLTCVASNTNTSQPAMASIVLDMTLRILRVKVVEVGTLWAGEQAEAYCRILGSRPPPNIVWWLGSLMLPPTRNKADEDEGNVTVSSLQFVPEAKDDGDMLICQATNEKLPDLAIQDSTLLSINYAPLVKVQLGRSLDPQKIKEGDDVYFECSVESKPPVFSVIWRHNGVELVSGAGIFLSNMSLVVQGVTRAHGGDYTCHATNIRATSASPPLHLDVKYTPVCASKQRQQHSVGKLENAEISCKVHANPRNVTFRWTFNNTAEAIDVPDGRFVVVGTESRVNYTPMNELDYGTLLCWANNTIGVQQYPCVFQIVAAGKPDPPHNCRVFDVTISSLQVKCLAGDDGGLSQQFLLQVYQVGSMSPVTEVSRPTPNFSITNLHPATSYKIVIAAINDKGASRLVELQAYTVRVLETLEETSAEPARDRDRGSGVPLAVLVGISVAVVPIVVAAVVLVKLRMCRGDNDGVGTIASNGENSSACAEATSTHSGQSNDAVVSTTEVVSDVSPAPDRNPDVVSHTAESLGWTTQIGDIATISPSSYLLPKGGPRYPTVTIATTIATTIGGLQYSQLVCAEPICTHIHTPAYSYPTSQMQTTSAPGSQVPYYNDTAQQHVDGDLQFSASPYKQDYHLPAHHQFSPIGNIGNDQVYSTLERRRQQQGHQQVTYQHGQENIAFDQGQPQVTFPQLYHTPSGVITKPLQGSPDLNAHLLQEHVTPALTSGNSPVPPDIQGILRRGSKKNTSSTIDKMQISTLPDPSQQPLYISSQSQGTSLTGSEGRVNSLKRKKCTNDETFLATSGTSGTSGEAKSNSPLNSKRESAV